VTKWKRNSTTNEKVFNEKTQKPILSFIAIKRGDTGDWALPGVSVFIDVAFFKYLIYFLNSI
jgi:hypothetical protein